MPDASIYPTVLPNSHRGAARLGDVFGQTNRIWRFSNDPSRCSCFQKSTTSLRPLLQFFQPFRLDCSRFVPSGLCGSGRPTQSARAVVSGRGRHAPAQTGQAWLWFGMVPRRGGLHGEARGDRLGQSLGGHGTGDPHPRNSQNILSADPRQTAPARQGTTQRGHLGETNARRRAELVPGQKAGFSRRWGIFGEKSAGRPESLGNAHRRDARRCGRVRSSSAQATQGQTRAETVEGTSPAQSPRRRQKGGSRTGRSVGLANCQSFGLRSDAPLEGAFVSSTLAQGVGIEADSGRIGSRSAGQVQRRLSVHHRSGRRSGLGNQSIFAKMVDRGCFQSQQTGDEHPVAAALVPTKHRKTFAVGVADAERDQLVVFQPGPQIAPGPRRTPSFGRVGYRMVASSHAPRASQCYPGTNNYHQLGHQSRPV